MRKYIPLSIFIILLILQLGCGLLPDIGEATKNLVNNLIASPTVDTQARYARITSAPKAGVDSAELFFDDFSDLNSSWETESDEDGGRGYTNGGYHIYVNESEWCYWTSINVTYADVIIEVDGQKLSGSDVNEYGVISRWNSQENFYYFGISSDGYYGIGKNINEEWIDLGEDGYNDRVINPGNATNHLKATSDFDQLSLEVNGTVLMDIVDPELRTGDIGIYACAYDEAGVDILFDNFRVSRP